MKTSLKLTINYYKESLIFVAASIQIVDDHIQHLQQKGNNVQPFIIVVGKDVINFKEIFLYFDGVKLLVSSERRTFVLKRFFFLI